MERGATSWTLKELAELLGGELDGPADLRIDRPVASDSDDGSGLAFADSPEHLKRCESSSVGAVLVRRGVECAKPCIRVDNPRAAFGRLLALKDRPLPHAPGVHPTAVIAAGAQIDPEASVGPYAVVEDAAVVGARARIYPFCYVGERCVVGEGAVLHPSVVLVRDVRVGPGSIVHSGAVLGADGFGFEWDGSSRLKVPQVGSVELGADVEIGANSTIDRATVGKTALGDGTKIDNLVQIAHNSRIGKHSVIAGQTGISGSTHIGDRVVMAGQVAVADHVTVASDTTFAGLTGITNDVKEPGVYFGMPARPIREAMRIMAAAARVPELIQRVRAIERRLRKDGEDPL